MPPDTRPEADARVPCPQLCIRAAIAASCASEIAVRATPRYPSLQSEAALSCATASGADIHAQSVAQARARAVGMLVVAAPVLAKEHVAHREAGERKRNA